jgi:phosphomannomutase/phosphoglucomutase
MVDDQGQPVYADRLLALLAKEALDAQPGAAVVYELSCTQALPDTIKACGGRAVPCPVGYAFVHEAMRATGAVLGGERAGHIFFGHPDFQFDDAFLATAKMVCLIAGSTEPLSIQLAQLPQYVHSPGYRLHCPDELKDSVVNRVCQRFAGQGYRVSRMDGGQIHFRDGWALFRASNTQPALTLHCEASDAKALDVIQDTVLRAVRKTLAGLGIALVDAH